MKKTLMSSEYDPNDLAEVWEDLRYSLDEFDQSNPHGKGKFRVSVIWCSDDDCDCVGFQHKFDCPHHEMCL